MKKLLTAALIIISLMLMLASCDSISDIIGGNDEPEITVSGDGYLVVDGVKTEHKVDDGKGEEADKITVSNDGYLTVNGIKTEHKVDTADIIIVDNDGYLTVNGVKTELKVDKAATVTLDNDGYVIVDGIRTEYKVHTADIIIVDNDGYLTVNGVKTEHRVDNKEYVITVNSDGYVVVNDVVTKYNVVEFECQHIFDTETVEATCTEDGYEVRTCQYCKIKTVNNKVDALGHDFAKTYNVDSNYHWYDCSRCDAISNKEYHIEGDDGCCTTCGIPLSSTPGVIYDVSADGTYAEVIDYTGTATKVRIAAEYQGLPVKTIYSEAFKNNKSITSVVIPDSVTSIGNSAFYLCGSLTSVTIPDSVTSIGSYAFSYCYSLTRVTIPNSITSIGSQAFHNCNSILYNEYEFGTYVGDKDNPYAVLIGLTNNNLSTYKINEATEHIAYGAFRYCKRLTSVTIPNSVTSIGDYAFEDCSSLTSVTIGNSVTSIGDWAFYDCNSLMSVTIPNSVTKIGDRAFYFCFQLTSIKYRGTQAEWDAISKGTDWDIYEGDYTDRYTITYNYTEE